MLTGKRFRLQRATIAVDQVDGKRRAVTIPTGAILQVISEPKNGDGLVNVRCDGRTIEMFALDVNVPGTEIDESASA